MLDVRQRVEPAHLGVRDAARELAECRGDLGMPADHGLPHHRCGFVGGEVVAVVPRAEEENSGHPLLPHHLFRLSLLKKKKNTRRSFSIRTPTPTPPPL